MQPTVGTPSKKFLSIVECAICANITQKIDFDLRSGDQSMPPEIAQLFKVLEIEDPHTHAYESNTTKLFKCQNCGTYYYYNHYSDDGEHFMDPKSDDLTIRRYTPLNVIRFLEGLIQNQEGTIPPTLGQMKTAFLEGTSLSRNKPTPEEQEGKTSPWIKELKELQTRYNDLLREYAHNIESPISSWQIQRYLIESLCLESVYKNDLELIRLLLFKNSNPVVRVEAAEYLLGIATGDAPVTDLIHIPSSERKTLKSIFTNQEFIEEIVQIFIEGAEATHHTTWQYDYGYGTSRYYKQDLPIFALYGLRVAMHIIDLTPFIPILFGLLEKSRGLPIQTHVYWTLRSFGEKDKKNAQLIMQELSQRGILDSTDLKSDNALKTLVNECQKKIGSKKAPAKSIRKSPTRGKKTNT